MARVRRPCFSSFPCRLSMLLLLSLLSRPPEFVRADSYTASTCTELYTVLASSTYDTVIIPSGVFIDVSSCTNGQGLPVIQSSLTIKAEDGAKKMPTISGGSIMQVFVSSGFSDSTLTLTGLLITNGLGVNSGGCVSVSSMNLVLNRVAFKNCVASNGFGGALYINSGTVSITKSSFVGNFAGTDSDSAGGGAIYSAGQQLPMSVSSSLFSNNFAYTSINSQYSFSFGGAIYSDGNLTVSNSNFTNNFVASIQSASAVGGAIRVDYNFAVVSGCYFFNNTAAASTYQGSGGAISAISAIVFNSRFLQNAAGSTTDPGSYSSFIENAGGAISADTFLEIQKSNFEQNSVRGTLSSLSAGGAVYLAQLSSTAIIRDSIFKSNKVLGAAVAGGAVLAGSLAISKSTFDSNFAQSIAQAPISNANSLFGNAFGGAIHSDTNDNSYTSYVNQSVFSNNFAQGFNTAFGGAQSVYCNLIDSTNSYTGNFATVPSNTAATTTQKIIGGAVASLGSYSSLEFISSHFESNSVKHYLTDAIGGAIGNDQSGSALSISQCTFTENSAVSTCTSSSTPCSDFEGGGGAVYTKGQLTVSKSTFEKNSHSSSVGADSFACGGGICAPTSDSSSVVSISDSVFKSNSASSPSGTASGGAIALASSSSDGTASLLLSCSLSGNKAQGFQVTGGALCVTNGGFNISKSSFVANQAKGEASATGGAVDLTQTTGDIFISSSNFQSNALTCSNGNAFGGALSFGDLTDGSGRNPVLLTTSQFFNNSVSSPKSIASGGALFVGYGQSSKAALISYSSFSANSARGGSSNGGALYLFPSQVIGFCKGNIFSKDGKNFKLVTSKKSTIAVRNDLDSGAMNEVHFCPNIPLLADSKSSFFPVMMCDLCDCSKSFSPCAPLAQCVISPQSNLVSCNCPASAKGNGFSCGNLQVCSAWYLQS